MAAGDRRLNGKPKDFVRHFGIIYNTNNNGLDPYCGTKSAGYVTYIYIDVTCKKCLKIMENTIKQIQLVTDNNSK